MPMENDEFSRGGSAPPDPPDLRLRAEMPMANDHAMRACLLLLVHQLKKKDRTIYEEGPQLKKRIVHFF